MLIKFSRHYEVGEKMYNKKESAFKIKRLGTLMDFMCVAGCSFRCDPEAGDVSSGNPMF
jgi:hypothetical protein